MDESDRDSVNSMEAYNEKEDFNELGEEPHMMNVRNSIRDWKVREFDKTTTPSSNAKGLRLLREYVANSGRLYYDLNNYLQTSQNKEENMKDVLYVKIVAAIGPPGSLDFHLKTMLETLLQRDLLELPFTIEPNVVNSYAKNGLRAQQEFPEEE
jgi:hypothetical protein